MKIAAIILIFSIQLLSSVSCTQNSNNMLKIPLKEPMNNGKDYPPVQFENLVLKPNYFQIYPEPDYSRRYGCDSIMKVQMMFDATIGHVIHPVYLQHYAITDDQRENIYPVALCEYLIGMEVTEGKNGLEAALTIERNDFGREFFLDNQQKAIIGELTVQVDRAGHKHASYSPDEPFTAIGICEITLSDENEQQSFFFTSREMEEKDWHPTEWGKYKVWILNMYDGRLKLKIDKNI